MTDKSVSPNQTYEVLKQAPTRLGIHRYDRLQQQAQERLRWDENYSLEEAQFATGKQVTEFVFPFAKKEKMQKWAAKTRKAQLFILIALGIITFGILPLLPLPQGFDSLIAFCLTLGTFITTRIYFRGYFQNMHLMFQKKSLRIETSAVKGWPLLFLFSRSKKKCVWPWVNIKMLTYESVSMPFEQEQVTYRLILSDRTGNTFKSPCFYLEEEEKVWFKELLDVIESKS